MKAIGIPGEQSYRRDVLLALLKWTLVIAPPAGLLNLLGFTSDPLWTGPVGSGAALLLALIAWWCLRLVRRGRVYQAARIYVVSGMSVMALVVFIADTTDIPLGAMGMCVFVVMATFFDLPQAALRWGLLSCLLYEAGFLARGLDPSRALGPQVDILSVYIAPSLNLLFLAFAGRIMNEYLTRALLTSESAARDLTRSYAEVEQRVAERTHDLVEEHARLEATLRQLAAARDQAEAASRAKSIFLANMSHELRTPLTTILGYTALMEHEARALRHPTLSSDLSHINTAGNQLLELISNVLDLAEAEAGTMELHAEPFEVAVLIDDVLDAVRPLVIKQNNRLETRYVDHPHVVCLDRAKVRRILVNLLSNAAKFTESGTIILEVTGEQPAENYGDAETRRQGTGTIYRAPTETRRQGDFALSPALPFSPSAFVVFRVTDSGIGIAPDQMPQLFHPFTQGDVALKRMYGGVGLGLAICQRYCQLMGGDVVVESAEGQGASFTVRLPINITSHPARTTPAGDCANGAQPAASTG